MTNTSSASVIRLPTAAAEPVVNPPARSLPSLCRTHGISRLPSPEARRLEAEQAIFEHARSSTELVLLFSILRCMPGWQARNALRLAREAFNEEGGASTLIAVMLAKVASDYSLVAERGA